MSEPENFIARWSRLKRETAEDAKPESVPPPSGAPPGDAESAAPERAAKTAPPESSTPLKPAFDSASLQPIESITADSDIRAYLQSGVPADLTRAALRRVWTEDPTIRDFIGIAENQWDFTDPSAIPGFGPLDASDDVPKLVAQAMGRLGELSDPGSTTTDPGIPEAASPSRPASSTCPPSQQHSHPQPTGMPEENKINASADGIVEEHNKIVCVAPQHTKTQGEGRVSPNRRTHGRALPQ